MVTQPPHSRHQIEKRGDEGDREELGLGHSSDSRLDFFSLSFSVILSLSILSLSLRLLSFPLSLPSSISPVKVRGDGEGVSKRWSREEEMIRRGKERKIKGKKRV